MSSPRFFVYKRCVVILFAVISCLLLCFVALGMYIFEVGFILGAAKINSEQIGVENIPTTSETEVVLAYLLISLPIVGAFFMLIGAVGACLDQFCLTATYCTLLFLLSIFAVVITIFEKNWKLLALAFIPLLNTLIALFYLRDLNLLRRAKREAKELKRGEDVVVVQPVGRELEKSID